MQVEEKEADKKPVLKIPVLLDKGVGGAEGFFDAKLASHLALAGMAVLFTGCSVSEPVQPEQVSTKQTPTPGTKKQEVERRPTALREIGSRRQVVEKRDPPDTNPGTTLISNTRSFALTTNGRIVEVNNNLPDGLSRQTFIRQPNDPDACTPAGLEWAINNNAAFSRFLQDEGSYSIEFVGGVALREVADQVKQPMLMIYRRPGDQYKWTEVKIGAETDLPNRIIGRNEPFGIGKLLPSGREIVYRCECLQPVVGVIETIVPTPTIIYVPETYSPTPSPTVEYVPFTPTAYPTSGPEYQVYASPTIPAGYRQQPGVNTGFVRVKKDVDLDGDRVQNTPRDLAIAANLQFDFIGRIGSPDGIIDRFSMRGSDQWARGGDYPCFVQGLPYPIPYYVTEVATYQGIDIFANSTVGHLCTDDFAWFLNVGRPLLPLVPPPPGFPTPVGPYTPVPYFTPSFPTFTPTNTEIPTSTITLTLTPSETPRTFTITPSVTSSLVIASATPAIPASPTEAPTQVTAVRSLTPGLPTLEATRATPGPSETAPGTPRTPGTQLPTAERSPTPPPTPPESPTSAPTQATAERTVSPGLPTIESSSTPGGATNTAVGTPRTPGTQLPTAERSPTQPASPTEAPTNTRPVLTLTPGLPSIVPLRTPGGATETVTRQNQGSSPTPDRAPNSPTPVVVVPNSPTAVRPALPNSPTPVRPVVARNVAFDAGYEDFGQTLASEKDNSQLGNITGGGYGDIISPLLLTAALAAHVGRRMYRRIRGK